MPRVGDLSKCKIYKIVSMNNPDLVYYGHTCQTLSGRFSSHKSPSNRTTSKIIIEKGDAIILLIEEYPCVNEMEANAREAFYVLNNPCVNKNVPGRTCKEYRDSHQEQIKQYAEEHKDQKKIYDKLHYDSNKDQIQKRSNDYYKSNINKIKQYRESNKDQILEKKKQYRESHKEEIKEYNRLLYLKKKAEK